MEKETRLAPDITVKPISADKAAPWFEGLKYPQGLEESAHAIARTSTCFEINAGARSAVFAIKQRGRTLWIDGARGSSGGGSDASGWLPIGFGIIESAAKKDGFDQIGLQTSRRGLVKQAGKHGYEVTGWILTKKI